MIPFFRKIRYQLAKDNQLFKYSRYAIGEIVLVVVGILIALQINNWNERRKGISEMKSYLNEVSQDLDKDKDYIDFMILKNDSVLVKYSTYRDRLNDSIQPDEMVAAQIQALSGNKIIIFPSRTSLEKLSSIDHIDNNLRRQLLELKIEQERLKRINEEQLKHQNETSQIALINGWNGPLATLASSNEELSNFLKYDERWPDLLMIIEGLLNSKFEHSRQNINDLENLDQRLDEIIGLIKQELNS